MTTLGEFYRRWNDAKGKLGFAGLLPDIGHPSDYPADAGPLVMSLVEDSVALGVHVNDHGTLTRAALRLRQRVDDPSLQATSELHLAAMKAMVAGARPDLDPATVVGEFRVGDLSLEEPREMEGYAYGFVFTVLQPDGLDRLAEFSTDLSP